MVFFSLIHLCFWIQGYDDSVYDSEELLALLPGYMGLIQGQRGNPKLVVDGYTFIPNKKFNGKTYWNCAQVKQKKCKARIITGNCVRSTKVTFHEHSHQREFNVDDIDELQHFNTFASPKFHKRKAVTL